MSIIFDIVRTVGSDPITRATEDSLMRALMDPEEDQPALFNLLHHLVACDHELLNTIAQSKLRDTSPELVTRLIVHSYNSAGDGRARGAVRTIANAVRLASKLPVAPGAGAILLTESQSAALERLDALVEIYLAQGGTPAPVRMRIAPLVVAPSGAGKTFLAGLLARRHGLGLFRTSISEWMVMGSKAEQPTLELLRLAITANPAGLVLHIDELDKLSGQEAWNLAQRGEIFCCADRQVTGGGWTDQHRAALRDRVFLLGTGTWQEVWNRQINRHRGFTGPDTTATSIEHAIRSSRVIPDELYYRFGPMIPIGPYTVIDHQRLAAQLGLGQEHFDPVAAAQSGLNFRAIELALSGKALVEHQNRRRAALNL